MGWAPAGVASRLACVAAMVLMDAGGDFNCCWTVTIFSGCALAPAYEVEPAVPTLRSGMEPYGEPSETFLKMFLGFLRGR